MNLVSVQAKLKESNQKEID